MNIRAVKKKTEGGDGSDHSGSSSNSFSDELNDDEYSDTKSDRS